jgi:hypothetical protein
MLMASTVMLVVLAREVLAHTLPVAAAEHQPLVSLHLLTELLVPEALAAHQQLPAPALHMLAVAVAATDQVRPLAQVAQAVVALETRRREQPTRAAVAGAATEQVQMVGQELLS